MRRAQATWSKFYNAGLDEASSHFGQQEVASWGDHMKPGEDERDPLAKFEISNDLRRRITAHSNIVSARRTLALAKVRCIPFNEKLRRLKMGLEEQFFDELAFAVGESNRSARQNLQLASIAAKLAKKADELRSGERAQLDRRVAKLLRVLPTHLARPIVMKYLSDQLKQRRLIGLKCITTEGIDVDFVQFLWGRFCETGDNALLKVILGKPIQLSELNPSKLVDSFAEDYWKMRVIEATLKADTGRGAAFATSHPRLFIWACGRLRNRQMTSAIVDCLSTASDQVELIDITAWALGKLGAAKDLVRLEALLDQLSDKFGITPT